MWSNVEPDTYWGAHQGRRRCPRPPASQFAAQLDRAIQSIASLAARPQFHAIALEQSGLLPRVFPAHPARSVNPALYGVLLALADAPVSAPSGLAVQLGLHPSTVCHHLARLEQRELITRRDAACGGPFAFISLTEPGILAFETVRDARQAMLLRLAESLGEERGSRLADDLSEFAQLVHRMHRQRRRVPAGRRQ
jgi:DNA-binding MarR family transcriptional regulator